MSKVSPVLREGQGAWSSPRLLGVIYTFQCPEVLKAAQRGCISQAETSRLQRRGKESTRRLHNVAVIPRLPLLTLTENSLWISQHSEPEALTLSLHKGTYEGCEKAKAKKFVSDSNSRGVNSGVLILGEIKFGRTRMQQIRVACR